jgi:hypothetical protein
LRQSTVRKKARDSYGKKTNQENALQSGSHIQPRSFEPEISTGTDRVLYHQEIGFLLIGIASMFENERQAHEYPNASFSGAQIAPLSAKQKLLRL